MALNIKERYSSFKLLFFSSMQDIVLRQVDNRYMTFSNSLNLYGQDDTEGCVFLKPENERPLYGVYLATESCMDVPYTSFGEMAQNYGYEDDARIILFYTKSKMVVDGDDSFCTKQSVFLFTPIRGIADDVAHFYDTDKMTSSEVAKALLEVGFMNEYFNDKESFDVKSNFEVFKDKFPFDDLFYSFKTIFSEGIYKAINKDNNCKEPAYTLYQGLGATSPFSVGSPRMKNFLASDWNGYVSFVFDFSNKRVKGYIEETRKNTRNYEKNKEIKDAYKKLKDEMDGGGAPKLSIVNVVALIDNKQAINSIASSLNVKFFEKSIFRKNIIYATPIMSRDYSCDGLGYFEDCGKYIQAVHKRHNMDTPKSKDIYGKDLAGNYTTYSFSETEESPHSAMSAPTRAGKTFFVSGFLIQSLGIEVESMGEEEYRQSIKDFPFSPVHPKDKVTSASKLGEVCVVHFDIGFSNLKFITALKQKFPKQTILYDDDLNNLRFGLTNVRYDEEENMVNRSDMGFTFAIINLILVIGGSEQLSAIEKIEMEEALDRVFTEDNYVGKELYKLEEMGGYRDALEKVKVHLKSQGKEYDKYAQTTEIGLRGTDLDFLQKPLLSDVLKELQNKSNNVLTKAKVAEICESAYAKLSVVSKNDIFSGYSKSNIAESDYFYMELQSIKDLGDAVFVPLFLTFISTLYRRDLARAQRYKDENKAPPKVFYIIEEAHNFFKYPVLLDFFDVFLRESARYNIHLVFITQSPKDFPEAFLTNIGTRMVMPSNSITGNMLDEYWASNEPENPYTAFYDKNKQKYTAFLKSGKGVVTIKTPVSESLERLLNSNPTEIKMALEAIEEARQKEDE